MQVKWAGGCFGLHAFEWLVFVVCVSSGQFVLGIYYVTYCVLIVSLFTLFGWLVVLVGC